ncbi:MAG: histidine kinase [Chitinophagales bacterium]|nr:histidine kinase [Chitinophagales bacterium]
MLLKGSVLYATSENKIPDKILFVNAQINEQADDIYQKILQGAYRDTVRPIPIPVGTAIWYYIPQKFMEKNLPKNYILTGFFNNSYLFQLKGKRWGKISENSVYLAKSKQDETVDRYSIRLYSDSSFPTTAYLIQSIRNNDYVIGIPEAKLMTQVEKIAWFNKYKKSKEFLDRLYIVLWGILIVCIVVFVTKFILSKDKTNLFFAISNLFFLLHFVSQYYLSRSNMDKYPFDSFDFILSVNLPIAIIGIAFFFLSYRFFYIKKYRKSFVLAKTNKYLTGFIIIVSIIIFLSNIKFPSYKYIANRLFYVSLVILLVLTIWIIEKNNKKVHHTEADVPFLIFRKGIIFLCAFVIFAFVLAFAFQNNPFYLDKFYLLTFPILLGVCSYNIFAITASTERDYMTTLTVNQLQLEVIEKESQVLQSALSPDFILHSLKNIDNAIRSLNYDLAQNRLYKFSDLLRSILNQSSKRYVTWSAEINILKLYLEIENQRSENFESFIFVDEDLDLEKTKVIPFLIQSNIENLLQLYKLDEQDSENITVQIVKSEEQVITTITHTVKLYSKRSFHENKKFLVRKNKIYQDIEINQRRLSYLSENCTIEVEKDSNFEIKIVLKTFINYS